jgi:hypothetical protein
VRAPHRDLAAAGQTRDDVAARVLNALASGLVLHRRVVSAGRGIQAVRLSEQWLLLRPVVEDGIVTALREDEETDEANRIGRHHYGIRSRDVSRNLLRLMAPDVWWLGPSGAAAVLALGMDKARDLWALVAPAALNHRPTFGSDVGGDVGTGVEPATALAGPGRGARDALAALLEGLHLVDVIDPVDGAERRTWKPLRPVVDDDGATIDYGVDHRVLRHTVNAGRRGFTNATFAAVAPLLELTDYQPRDVSLGHSYRLSPGHAQAAADAIAWMPETIAHPSDRQAPPSEPTDRERMIVDVLEGAEGDLGRRAPSHAEVARAVSHHAGDVPRLTRLIEAALERTTRNVVDGRPARAWDRT